MAHQEGTESKDKEEMMVFMLTVDQISKNAVFIGLPSAIAQRGDPGDRGDPSPYNPLPGERGDPGFPGPNGVKGRRGDNGLPGPMGRVGAVGLKGSKGPKGVNGTVFNYTCKFNLFKACLTLKVHTQTTQIITNI